MNQIIPRGSTLRTIRKATYVREAYSAREGYSIDENFTAAVDNWSLDITPTVVQRGVPNHELFQFHVSPFGSCVFLIRFSRLFGLWLREERREVPQNNEK